MDEKKQEGETTQAILARIDEDFQQELVDYQKLVISIRNKVDKLKIQDPEKSDNEPDQIEKSTDEYTIRFKRKLKCFSGLNYQLGIILERLEEII
jgi:hypothetical protein